MGHSKHKKSKRSEELSDIIPMSNDDSINERKNSIVNSDDEENTESENEEVYERKGYNHKQVDDDINSEDDTDNDSDDEYTAPVIKSKKAKSRRKSVYANEEISEIKRENGVQQLSNKINDLHRVQIAIPYGQLDPQRMPEINGVNNYQLTDSKRKRKKESFWKSKSFLTVMKVIICVCVLIIFGVFVYKYLKAVEALKQRNQDIFNDDRTNQPHTQQYDELAARDVLNDKTYNSIGNVPTRSTVSIAGGNKNKSIRRLPQRDARGRFIKQ